jgi:hypothetical protein
MRVGGCPVLLLESEGEACHSVLPLSRLGPNGMRAYRGLVLGVLEDSYELVEDGLPKRERNLVRSPAP